MRIIEIENLCVSNDNVRRTKGKLEKSIYKTKKKAIIFNKRPVRNI